jgi:hypothetical protein
MYIYIIYHNFTVTNMKMAVLLDVALCSLILTDVPEKNCLHNQGDLSDMEKVNSKTSDSTLSRYMRQHSRTI